jgi:hypothetical protein
MSRVPLLLAAWLVQAIAAAVVVTPVAFLARRRVHWRSWELLSLLIPFCIWATLLYSPLSTGWKSLANPIVEPGILGLTLGVGALARVAMSTRIPEERAGLVTMFGMWVVAAVIYWVVPGLEE